MPVVTGISCPTGTSIRQISRENPEILKTDRLAPASDLRGGQAGLYNLRVGSGSLIDLPLRFRPAMTPLFQHCADSTQRLLQAVTSLEGEAALLQVPPLEAREWFENRVIGQPDAVREQMETYVSQVAIATLLEGAT